MGRRGSGVSHCEALEPKDHTAGAQCPPCHWMRQVQQKSPWRKAYPPCCLTTMPTSPVLGRQDQEGQNEETGPEPQGLTLGRCQLPQGHGALQTAPALDQPADPGSLSFPREPFFTAGPVHREVNFCCSSAWAKTMRKCLLLSSEENRLMPSSMLEPAALRDL